MITISEVKTGVIAHYLSKEENRIHFYCNNPNDDWWIDTDPRFTEIFDDEDEALTCLRDWGIDEDYEWEFSKITMLVKSM